MKFPVSPLARWLSVSTFLLSFLIPVSQAAITTERVKSGGILIQSDFVNFLGPNEPTIIESDAISGGDRDQLQSTVTCEFATDINGGSALYRVCAELIRDDGTTIILSDGNGGTQLQAYSASRSVNPGLFLSEEDFEVALDPESTLDPDFEYRIDATLQRGTFIFVDGQIQVQWNDVDDEAGVNTRIFHFTGTADGDAERNIVGYLSSVALQRNHLVNTAEDLDTLPVEAALVLRRYDEYNSPAVSTDVTVEVDFDLLETNNAGVPTGVSIPLVNDGVITQTVGISSWASVIFTSERAASRRELTFSGELELDGVQLPSASRKYVLRATLRHVEVAAAPAVDDSVLETGDERILHFNGRFLAGANEFVLNSMANSPPVGAIGAGSLVTNVQVNGFGARLIGNSNVGFGNGEVLSGNLFDDGRFELQFGSATVTEVANPSANIDREFDGTLIRLNDTRVQFGGVFASTATLHLPQGLTVTANISNARGRYESQIDVGGAFVPINNNGAPPVTLSRDFPMGGGFVDEAHPILFGASKVEVNTTNGRIFPEATTASYLHDPALTALETAAGNGQLDSPSLAERRSNDQFFRRIIAGSVQNVAVESASDGTSRLQAQVELDPTTYETHFPRGGRVEFQQASVVSIVNGEVDLNGSNLNGIASVKVEYAKSCPDGCVGGAAAVGAVSFEPDGNVLAFTPQGGIANRGTVQNGGQLDWGLWDDGGNPQYAHRTGTFNEADFFAPGYQLYASRNSLFQTPGYQSTAAEQAPGVLLLAGWDRENEQFARFGQAEYRDGIGAYAGMNLQVQDGMQGASRPGKIGADWTYTLIPEAAKYYVRASGVSGRHPAEENTFAENLVIYGYDFSVFRYQMTYLSNENERSWFDAGVSVPAPANFDQAFSGIKLSCSGDLGQMEIDPKDNGSKELQYWLGSFTPLAAEFRPPEGTPECVNADRALVFAASTKVANIPTTLYGQIGFINDGNIVAAGDGFGVDSRFGLPAKLQVDGPGDENYAVTAVTKLYFNDFDNSDGNNGFVTFASSMDVPFFKNLQVQVRTSPNGASSANLFLAGGYSVGGETHFTDGDFDSANTGWPRGLGDIDFARYWEPTDTTPEKYLVTASQSFFGLVDVSYPLDWSIGAHYFTGRQRNNDLLVINIDHNVDYLSAENAEISFGASYGGLPRLNLSNMLFNVVDEQLGAGQSFVNAGLDEVRDTLGLGIDNMADMLDDSMEAVFDAAFAEAENEVLRPLYRAAESSYDTMVANDPTVTYNDWINDATDGLEGELTRFLTSTTSAETSLVEQLQKLKDANAEAASIVMKVEDALTQIIIGIDSVAGTLERGQNGDFQLDLPGNQVSERVLGLLQRGQLQNGSIVGTERDIVGKLVKELLRELVDPEVLTFIGPLIDAATSDLNTRLNALLEEVNPALDKIQEVLLDVRGIVVAIRSEIVEVGDFVDLIDQVVSDAIAEIQAIAAAVKAKAKAFVQQIVDQMAVLQLSPMAEQQNPFDQMTEDEFVALCRAELRDLFLASDLVEQIRYMLRQKLFDIDMQIRSAVDSAFASLGKMMKDLIRDTVGELESEINPLLGTIEEYLGSGEITGYAHIERDSLRKLRLDGNFQLNIPEEMGLTAYLEILVYDSGDDYPASGCLEPGEEVTEVRFGAIDVSLDWISDDMRASVEAKFSMKKVDGVTRPNGVGGSFEMTGGELDFQSFKVFRLQASLGIGADECYLAAAIGVKLSGYSAEGGVFFGRTCTIDPIEMIDPEAANLIGSPPFTGAYLYGEVWIPISEVVLGVPASCLFEISAGVGAGAFYFVEGPTYGGRMLLGVSGEALCVVSIRGEVSLVGVMAGGDLRFTGTGRLTGKAGWCPFCVKFGKSVGVTYQNGSWSLN